jgi:hypothetical protein
MKKFTLIGQLLSVAAFLALSTVALPPLPAVAEPKLEVSIGGVSGAVAPEGKVWKETDTKVNKNNPGRPTKEMEADPLKTQKKDPEGHVVITRVKVSEEANVLATTGKKEGDLPLGGKGDVQASVTAGGYEGKFTVTEAGVKLEGEAALIEAKAEANAAFENAFGEQKLSGHAELAIKAEGEGEISWKGGEYGAHGSVGAFAGVRAKGEGSWKSPSVFGVSIVAAGSIEGQAGAGAQASGAVYWKDGKLHVGGQVSAALGIGGGASGEITLDFSELIADPKKAVDKTVGQIKDIAGDIKDTAEKVGDFLGGVAEKAKSGVEKILGGAKQVGKEIGDIIGALNDIASGSDAAQGLPVTTPQPSAVGEGGKAVPQFTPLDI